MSTKIVGGVRARVNEIPWQVGLTTNPDALTVFFFCGGSLLNLNFVMTAAHCTVRYADNRVHTYIA